MGAKGGLVPDHLLILPIGHSQSAVDLSDDVTEEVNKFKDALRTYFKNEGKGVVFFERNFKTQHMQVQVVPVPLKLKDEVTHSFMEIGEQNNIEFELLEPGVELSDIAESGTPYFHAEMPNYQQLFCTIKKNFPLQFGREVVACSDLLDIEDRVDWSECKISKDEEINLVKSFKQKFTPYDFTQEDSD